MLNPAFWATPWHQAWPEPQNIYFEEWQLEEDHVQDNNVKDILNARAVDIIYHQDWRDDKERIMRKMVEYYDELNDYASDNKRFEKK